MSERGPKETAYDERIAPLMADIIKTCKAHKINMAAQFVLDPPPEDSEETSVLRCTTVLKVDESDEEGLKHVEELRRVMYPAPQMFAFTIIGKDPR